MKLSLAANIWLVQVFIVLLASFCLEKGRILYGLIQTYNCIVLYKFSTHKIINSTKILLYMLVGTVLKAVLL